MIGARAEQLKAILRPPGGGIPAFSTGVGAELELQKKLFGTNDRIKIQDRWVKSLEKISHAKVLILGVPLDTGAGIRRGAAYGPRVLRNELLKNKSYVTLLKSGEVLDLGDIFVNPHLLEDKMLNLLQIEKCQAAMYPSLSERERSELPVSALSQLAWVLDHVSFVYPKARFLLIGGDHSVAGPHAHNLIHRFPKNLGVVQPDAHTDLLESRLGVKHCFATWSFHAAKKFEDKSRFVQVGVRASGKTKEFWQDTVGVTQYWSSEIKKTGESKTVQKIVDHLKQRGVSKLYFSNDIDGTDASEVAATGTPEGKGPSSKFYLELIDALGSEFEWVGADLVELAPSLAKNSAELNRTLKVCGKYVLSSLKALLRD